MGRQSQIHTFFFFCKVLNELISLSKPVVLKTPETFFFFNLFTLEILSERHIEVNWVDSCRLTKSLAGLRFAWSRAVYGQPKGAIVLMGLPGAGATAGKDPYHIVSKQAREVR